HERLEGRVRRATSKTLGIAAEAAEVVRRQVDPATVEVFGQVAEDVGQLQRDAGVFGVDLRLLPAKSPNVDARQPDGRRDAVAVAVQGCEVGEVNRVQVHLDAVEHVFEVHRRHVETYDRVMESRVER